MPNIDSRCNSRSGPVLSRATTPPVLSPDGTGQDKTLRRDDDGGGMRC